MIGYEYGNTRVRAMRSRLLGAAEMSEMLVLGSLDRMLARLADSPYGPDVEAALVRAQGLRRLDEAIRSNLARTLQQMASFYGEDTSDRVALLLQRWDVHNLRSLLRLPSTPFQPEDLVGLLVPAGRLTEADLGELASRPDIRSRLDLLIAWELPSPDSATILAAARAGFEREGDSSTVERALAEAFAAEMAGALGDDRSGAARVLRSEVDSRNLSTALRRQAARLDHEPGWSEPSPYIDGGLVASDGWVPVSEADSRQSAAGILSSLPLPSGWDDAIRRWVSHGRLPSLEGELGRAITAAALHLFTAGDPLGFDIPLAFTFAKEAEARNLRLVGRTLVHDLPVVEVEEFLEVVR